MYRIIRFSRSGDLGHTGYILSCHGQPNTQCSSFLFLQSLNCMFPEMTFLGEATMLESLELFPQEAIFMFHVNGDCIHSSLWTQKCCGEINCNCIKIATLLLTISKLWRLPLVLWKEQSLHDIHLLRIKPVNPVV